MNSLLIGIPLVGITIAAMIKFCVPKHKDVPMDEIKDEKKYEVFRDKVFEMEGCRREEVLIKELYLLHQRIDKREKGDPIISYKRDPGKDDNKHPSSTLWINKSKKSVFILISVDSNGVAHWEKIL